MTLHVTHRQGPRWVLVLFLLLTLMVSAPSADAARGGKKSSVQQLDDTSGTLVTSTDDPKQGDLDPTTVPIVDEDLLFSVTVARAQVQADDAHVHATGAGMVVAVLDGGFNLNHPDIAANVLPFGYDAIDGDGDVTDLGDGYDTDGDGRVDGGLGHGTFVIGMILTAAPDAMILPIRVRDDEGYGSDEETIRGFEYALAMGADVVNWSGGEAQARSKKLLNAIVDLHAAGVPVCIAAGNDAWDGISKAAGSGIAIGVGAVDASDCLAPWSNYQARAVPIMVCAPGVDLYGPIGAPYDYSNGYWSGTSFATGFASGAAALVLEVHPDFQPPDVFEQLAATCDPAWDRHGSLMASGGRINLYRAVTE